MLNFKVSSTYLRYVIVGISFQSDMDTLGKEGTETLTSRALAVDYDASLWKTLLCLLAENN